MKTNEEKIKAFLEKSLLLEKRLMESSKLIDDMENDEKSVQNFYDKKDKYKRLLNYFKDFNNVNLGEFNYIYTLITDKQAKNFLNGFLKNFSEILFYINISVNTYTENIINYKMAKRFLPNLDLNKVSCSDISYKFDDIDIKEKINFIKDEFFELTSSKNLKGGLKQILKSAFPKKFSYYSFFKTEGKLKVLQDFEKYFYYRQLLFRLNRYEEQLGKKIDNSLIDINFMNSYNDFLLNGDLIALKEFIFDFFVILMTYPFNIGDSEIILKSIFNNFGFIFQANGEVKVEKLDEMIDEVKKSGDDYILDDLLQIKDLIQRCYNILYKKEYGSDIEKYKNENNLNYEEYEHLKDMRFSCLFLDGMKVFTFYDDIRNKLKNESYYNFLLNTSDFFMKYKITKKDKREFEEYITKLLKKDYPVMFIDDLNYIKNVVHSIKN